VKPAKFFTKITVNSTIDFSKIDQLPYQSDILLKWKAFLRNAKPACSQRIVAPLPSEFHRKIIPSIFN
jgi:hypothetical protein